LLFSGSVYLISGMLSVCAVAVYCYDILEGQMFVRK